MSAVDIAAVVNDGDIGSSGLPVKSPRPSAPGSPHVLDTETARGLDSLATIYASPLPMPPSPPSAFQTEAYFPSALPDKLAFGRDLSKPLVPLILNPKYDPINRPPTAQITLLRDELERAKQKQRPPVSGSRRNPRTRATSPMVPSRSLSRTRATVDDIVASRSLAPSPEPSVSPIRSFSSPPQMPPTLAANTLTLPTDCTLPDSGDESDTPKHTPVDPKNPLFNYHNPPALDLGSPHPNPENKHPLQEKMLLINGMLEKGATKSLLKEADRDGAEAVYRGHSEPPPDITHMGTSATLSGPAVFNTVPVPTTFPISEADQDSLLVNMTHAINTIGINLDKSLARHNYTVAQNLVQSIVNDGAFERLEDSLSEFRTSTDASILSLSTQMRNVNEKLDDILLRLPPTNKGKEKESFGLAAPLFAPSQPSQPPQPSAVDEKLSASISALCAQVSSLQGSVSSLEKRPHNPPPPQTVHSHRSSSRLPPCGRHPNPCPYCP